MSKSQFDRSFSGSNLSAEMQVLSKNCLNQIIIYYNNIVIITRNIQYNI